MAAVLPMAFVGGLMGPYMRPIPIGATAAMFFSLAIAFIVTPWAAVRVLPRKRGNERQREKHTLTPATRASAGQAEREGRTTAQREDSLNRIYRRLMQPLIFHRRRRWIFLAGIVTLLIASTSLVVIGWVKVKMLPFDNKSEFQIILNMPEGSALERTAEAARAIAAAVRVEPEVVDYQIYVGVSAPFNFNGLVRHYFMRHGASVADLQINLVGKEERQAQSHDIVRRFRPRVAAIAAKYDARVAVAEVPPGPPVLRHS
jgi:multidrug efflux pump subunit AcrB